MKYCTKCFMVHEDTVESCCDASEFAELPIEAKCSRFKCNATTNLRYTPLKHYTYSSGTYGNECQCLKCEKEIKERIRRSKATNYIIFDVDSDTATFFEESSGVEKYLDDYIHGMDCPSDGEIDEIVILEVVPFSYSNRSLKANDFNPTSDKLPVIVFNGELYEIDDASHPSIEVGYELSVSWR